MEDIALKMTVSRDGGRALVWCGDRFVGEIVAGSEGESVNEMYALVSIPASSLTLEPETLGNA